MNLFSWKQPGPRAAKKAAQHSGVMVSRKFLSGAEAEAMAPLWFCWMVPLEKLCVIHRHSKEMELWSSTMRIFMEFYIYIILYNGIDLAELSEFTN